MEEFTENAISTEAEVSAPFVPDKETYTVVDIRFREGGKTYFFDPDKLELAEGDRVIIDTSRGPEFGTCTAGNHTIPAGELVSSLRSVIRIATEQDCKIAAENREKEKNAFRVCQEKIAEYKLDMQLVSTEWAFDGSKVLFFFTADERVDFRELVKCLASIFRTRIELRQIGVRDKAKMVGGLGVCGRPFCCREFLPDFQPVSIKMAKTQSLSLNPTKISGTCGRLMCCLKYEQDAYEDLIKNAPKADSLVDTPDGRGTITEVCLLKQCIKVRMEKDPDTVNSYRNEQIAVLRSGKAKKNDTPIPEDYAPISSAVPADDIQTAALETPEILFRNETPAAVQEGTPAEESREKPAQNRNRRHSEKRKLPKAEAGNPEKQETAAEQPHNEEQKKSSRKHHGGHGRGEKSADNAQPAEQKQEKAQNENAENKRRRHSDKNTAPAAKSEQPAAVPAQAQPADGTVQAAKKRSNHRYYHHRGSKKSSGGNAAE